MSNGLVFFKGKSELNGDRIVAIATKNSKNVKTGDMVQTWILPDKEGPIAAIKSGIDESVCGDCKHRPANNGSCYVNVGYGPNQVWKSYKAGKYEIQKGKDWSFFKNSLVRFGAYGEPVAIPISIWIAILAVCLDNTSYSHQWMNPKFQKFKAFTMASCDSVEEQIRAKQLGWRTFRVKKENEPAVHREFVCPASAEANHKLTCAECLLCNGMKWPNHKDIVINVHGLEHKKKNFEKGRLSLEVI